MEKLTRVWGGIQRSAIRGGDLSRNASDDSLCRRGRWMGTCREDDRSEIVDCKKVDLIFCFLGSPVGGSTVRGYENTFSVIFAAISSTPAPRAPPCLAPACRVSFIIRRVSKSYAQRCVHRRERRRMVKFV